MVRLLCGENEFELGEEKRSILNRYLAENDAIGVEVLDGQEASPAQIKDAILQLPFLVASKLVLIHNPFAQKSTIDVLAEHADEVPVEIDVVLLASKPDKRTKLYKQLSVQRAVREFVAKKSASLSNWTINYAKKLGAVLSPEDASYLIARVGENQMVLAREIEKLAIGPKIDRALIDELTEQQLDATVFELLDTVFSGNRTKTLLQYRLLLAQKVDPNEIMGLIAWQLHIIAMVKYASQNPGGMGRTGVHPFVLGKAEAIASRMSVDQVKESVARALRTDQLIKTGKADAENALGVLLLELTGAI